MSAYCSNQGDVGSSPAQGKTNFSMGVSKGKNASLRSWRDFVRECFCFGSEAVNASGEAVRG